MRRVSWDLAFFALSAAQAIYWGGKGYAFLAGILSLFAAGNAAYAVRHYRIARR
jgi:hypothetical protein